MKKATVKNGLKYALVAGGVLALVPTVYGQGIGERTLDRMTMGTPQQVERGAEVFDDQCAECHGDEGLEATELGERMGARGFVDVDVDRSGIYSIYDAVTTGFEFDEDDRHPTFDNLRYQDRWAVAHYTHELIDDPEPDPPQLVDRVRRQARQGICDPEVRGQVMAFASPEDDEQIEAGAEVWEAECVACHGDEGRGAIPAARDFHDPADEWVRGTSPFALFETLEQGIEDTQMASFAHMPDDDLWATVHFMRDRVIPDDNLEEVTDEEIEAICRSMSAPSPPDPIPVERAKQFLAEDAQQERYIQLTNYGPPVVLEDADTRRGEELFQQSCAGCHGAEGDPDDALGPYGKFPPYMSIEPSHLEPASAGGTYRDLADRVIERAHRSLPDGPRVATFSSRDWRDLQAWMVTLEGEHGLGRDRIQTVETLDDARQFLDDEPVDEQQTDEDEEPADQDEEPADQDEEPADQDEEPADQDEEDDEQSAENNDE